jgi:hypothetical protein
LVLFMAKGFSPLNTCENVWMWMLVLKLGPKVVYLLGRHCPKNFF